MANLQAGMKVLESTNSNNCKVGRGHIQYQRGRNKIEKDFG